MARTKSNALKIAFCWSTYTRAKKGKQENTITLGRKFFNLFCNFAWRQRRAALNPNFAAPLTHTRFLQKQRAVAAKHRILSSRACCRCGKVKIRLSCRYCWSVSIAELKRRFSIHFGSLPQLTRSHTEPCRLEWGGASIMMWTIIAVAAFTATPPPLPPKFVGQKCARATRHRSPPLHLYHVFKDRALAAP